MATRRKTRPLVGNGRDGKDYAEFMSGLLDGSIVATVLVDTTVPDGTRDIALEQRDEDGRRLPDLIVTVQKRRLTKLEFDDPQG